MKHRIKVRGYHNKKSKNKQHDLPTQGNQEKPQQSKGEKPSGDDIINLVILPIFFLNYLN